MKKTFLILLCGLVSIVSMAQKSPGVSTGNSLARDTVTNTAVKNWNVASSFSGPQAYVTLHVDVTKISGTAGGTIVPLASNTGVNYGVAGSGSITVADNAGTTAYVLVVPAGYNYYGFRYTGSGTMSCSAVGWITRK